MTNVTKLPAESRELLESAIKLLHSRAMHADELVLMAYHLGRMDGALAQLDRDRQIAMEAILGSPE